MITPRNILTVPAFFRRSFIALTLLLTLCVAQKVQAASAPKYTITPILPPNDIIPAPDLDYGNPPHIRYISLTAINDSGAVIGSYPHDFGSYRGNIGFVWSNGKFSILKPSSVASNISTTPKDINNAGVVVGVGYGGNVYEPYPIPLRWSNYSDEPLVLPTENGNYNYFYPIGINVQGQILGTSNFNYPCLWQSDGKFVRLASTSSDGSLIHPFYLTSFNNAGIACGTEVSPWSRAVRHNVNTGITTLLESPLDVNGYSSSFAYAINNLGISVGGSIDGASLWNAAGKREIIGSGGATSINDKNQVVGGDTGNHGFLWTREFGQVDLNNCLINGAGWEIYGVSDINNKGQIIGVGVYNSRTSGFLLTPESIPTPTPSPSTSSTLSGRVTDGGNGQGLPNSYIALNQGSPRQLKFFTYTGADGTYRFDSVTPGTYNAFVYKAGYGLGFSNGLTIMPGQQAKLDFALTKPIVNDQWTQIKDLDGKAVVGIVCDNLPNMSDDQKNKIVISTPLLQGAKFNGAYVSNDKFSRTNDDSTGSTEFKNGDVYYTPPNEFNENQTPTSTSQLTRSAVRDVYVWIDFDRNGKRVVLGQKISLARPPVVLVHGINSDPSNWDPFVTSLRQSVPNMPFVRVNHSNPAGFPNGLINGNGPVEIGADLLKKEIAATLTNVRNGNSGLLNSNVIKNPTDPTKPFPLAIKRVDVVAWSYGGAITRWYIQSRGNSKSRDWYHRDGYRLFIPAVTYNNDIRKVITLGSMWRGVPMSNYANEVWFAPAKNGINFGKAPFYVPGAYNPITRLPTTVPLRFLLSAMAKGIPIKSATGIFSDLKLETEVPSMEVMAIDSPWMSQLVYGKPDAAITQEGSSVPVAKPFDENIAYGSVAGDNNAYGPGHLVDPYTLIDNLQVPSWFSGFSLEHDFNSRRNFTDGIVPVWSAAIPGNYKITHCNHSDYAADPVTQQYVLQWLNNSSLPKGKLLNNTWNLAVTNGDKSKFWTFTNAHMAPDPQYKLYVQLPGDRIGRLNPDAIKPR